MALPRILNVFRRPTRRPLSPLPSGPTVLAGLAFAFALALAFPAPLHAALPPGTSSCDTNLPAGYGAFEFIQGSRFTQNPGAIPAAAAPPAAAAAITLLAPDAYSISNAAASGPGGFSLPLTPVAGGAQWSADYSSESNLLASLPVGLWNVSFQGAFALTGDAFVGFFPLLLSSNLPPIPQLSNLEAAQAVSPTAAFTLNWSPWIGSGTNDRIAVVLTDATGTEILTAATDCAGELPLATGASSLVIPAGRLAAGRTYSGYLTFASALALAQDDSVLLAQRAYLARTTQFQLRTTGSSTGGEPAELTDLRLTASNLFFTVTGNPGVTYLLQSTTNLVDWTQETSLTLPATGRAQVTLTLAEDGLPRFYRALPTGGGGPGPGGEAAALAATLLGSSELDLAITGTPGATYTLQTTTNLTSWNAVQEITLPASTNRVVVRLTVATGASLVVYRAVSTSNPTPPTGKSPTLTVTSDPAGLRITVSAGDPQRAYGLQKTNPAFGTWTDTPTTLTTDATGNASTVVSPAPAEPAAFFRAVAK